MDNPNQPEKRSAPVLLALTPAEKASFRAAARAQGTPLTVWLRQQAHRALREAAAEAAKHAKAVAA